MGSCFYLDLIKPGKKSILGSQENIRDRRPEPNLMIQKVKILKEGCPQTNQKTEEKIETEDLHSDHDKDEIQCRIGGGGGGGGGGAPE